MQQEMREWGTLRVAWPIGVVQPITSSPSTKNGANPPSNTVAVVWPAPKTRQLSWWRTGQLEASGGTCEKTPPR